MPPNLNYYKNKINPLFSATRKNNMGNRNNTANRNKTLRPTLKRSRGKRNLLRINNGATRKKGITFSSNIGAQNNVTYINANNKHEGNVRNKKKLISFFSKKKNYHGTEAREGLGESYMNEYNKRREQMTQEERNAENEEQRELTENLNSKAPKAKVVSEYRKGVLKKLNGKILPNNKGKILPNNK